MSREIYRLSLAGGGYVHSNSDAFAHVKINSIERGLSFYMAYGDDGELVAEFPFSSVVYALWGESGKEEDDA